MSEAITSLSQKGIFIFESEAEAVEAAILMHDIGHGPFSHVLENTLTGNVGHEQISLFMMEQINKDMNGSLNLAMKIFKNEYPKKFLHQLISSQLDVDRLDYLRRDCFFTGVTEGNIGSARIIKMLDVVDDNLVVNSKGIYSIENYLTSRRLMYWQVYLHKTTVACEKMLVNTLMRAKYLAKNGKELFAPPSLRFFLYNDIDEHTFTADSEALHHYSQLDDNDIWCTIKEWAKNDDKILSLLSKDLVNRNIFKVEVFNDPIEEEYIEKVRTNIAKEYNLSTADTEYLINISTIQKDMYDVNDEQISILYKDGTVKDISEASELFNMSLLSKKIRKYYLCYQRL